MSATISESDRVRTSVVQSTLARDRLGAPSVMFFEISSAAPLTVIAGVVTTALATTKVIALPLAFAIVAAVLAVFVPGYLAMARHIRNTGAFYAYVSQGLSRSLGVAAAFIALIAYNALQVGLYGAWGTVTSGLLAQWAGLHVAWYWPAAVAWLVVAVLGALRIDVAGRVLAVLLVAEIAVVLVFDVAVAPHPFGGHPQLATLDPAHLSGGWGAALAMALLGFVGIEQGAVLQEESRNPRRTVRRATYAAGLLILVLYAGSSFIMGWGAGTANLVARAGAENTALFFNLGTPYLGHAMADVANVLFCTSLGAALISFNASCSRYAFALGREGVLPRRLGRTSRRQGSPRTAAIVQSVIGAAAIAVWAVAGWNPLVTLFYYGGTFGGFGVLLLFTVTSIAVLVYFWLNPRGESVWVRLVMPSLATVGLAVVVVLALLNYDVLLGVKPADPLRWVLPGVYLVAAVLGIAWAVLLRWTRPRVFAGIGLGVHADAGAGAA